MGCRQMKGIWNKRWFIMLISLLFAIVLVVYIDSTQTGFVTQGEPKKTRQTANETQTISVPLQVSVDTDKYYVVGYPEKVKITLEGSNALVTSTVNTQSFRAYIDLTHKRIGKQTVRVQVTGLNSQLSYTINPATVNVNIERRRSRTMPVQIEYNKNAVAKGYNVDSASVDPQKVEVTGARGEVNQIDQIVAKLPLPNGIDHTYSRQVILVAEDKKGRQLNVVINPATAKATLPISVSRKDVKLSLSPKNEESNKVYSVTAKHDTVTVYGQKSVLKKIKNLNVDVDLKGVSSSTVKTYPLVLPKGIVKADPSSVQIAIKVKNSGN